MGIDPKKFYILQCTPNDQRLSVWDDEAFGLIGRLKKNGGTPLQFEETATAGQYYLKCIGRDCRDHYIRSETVGGVIRLKGGGSTSNRQSFTPVLESGGYKLQLGGSGTGGYVQCGSYGYLCVDAKDFTIFSLKEATPIQGMVPGGDISIVAQWDPSSSPGSWIFECNAKKSATDAFFGVIKVAKNYAPNANSPEPIAIYVTIKTIKKRIVVGASVVHCEVPCDIYINNMRVKENATRGEKCGPYWVDITRWDANPKSEADHVAIRVVPRDLFSGSVGGLPPVGQVIPGDPTLILKRKIS